MAYEVTRQVFNTGTGAIGSKIVIAGAPSKPKAIILKLAGNVGAADGVTSQDMRQASGMAGERLGVITQGVCGTSALNGAGTTDTHRWLRDDAVIEMRDAAGVDNGRAFLDTFDAGGVTLEVASVFNQNYRVEIIMLGGSSLTDAELKSFFLPVVNGNFDVTPYNFQPDFMFLSSEFDLDPTLPDDHNGGVNGLGVCVSSTQQGYLTHRDQRAVPTTDSKTSCLQGPECLSEVRSSNPDARIALVTFLPNGARFNMVEFQNADRAIGLALKGGDYTIAEMLTLTDTVTDIDVTGLPSKPAGGIVISGFRSEDAVNTQQPDFRQSVGFWDGVTQGVQAAFGEDGVGTSNVATGQRGDAVYQSIGNVPSQEGAMQFISRGATSAKFRMSDADPVSRFAFGVFFGPLAVVPPGPFPTVQATATSLEDAADVTSHTVVLPANISAGDLLIICFSVDGAPTITWPSGANDGFTEFFNVANGTAIRFAIAYRQANGLEPATVEVATSGAQRSAHITYRITGHVDPSALAPEASTGKTGVNNAPNPLSLTPTGGAKDYLWLATHGRDRDRTIVTFPAGYANGISTQGSGSGSAGLATAERNLNASVEDPGSFSFSNADEWVACTVAIHPIGANTDLLGDAAPGSYAFTGFPATLELTLAPAVGGGGADSVDVVDRIDRIS